MSDEDDNYADYDAIGEDNDDLDEAAEGPSAPQQDDEDDEEGLVDENVGTDYDTDDEAEDPQPKATPQKRKVDTMLHNSNRNRNVIVVPPDERVTDNRLHKSEASYIISMRAQQIAKHGTTFTEATGLHDPVAIAFKELLDRKCPFTLRRMVGTNPDGSRVVEEWNPREMVLPLLTPPVPLG